jgi:lysophospholipid acyltransferase (LPLAT)-like uncharacterized protein
MKFSDRLLLAIAPGVAARFLRVLHWSIKTDIIGQEHSQEFWNKREPIIFSCWHDELLMIPLVYCGPGASVLISASKDGELISRTVKHLGISAVRGSSSRGGRTAFRELLSLTKESFDLGITPDGPRGPRHQLKDGVIQLARLSGRPVVPVSYMCSKGHRFASWDRFLLPLPFGRAVFSYGEPLFFDREERIEQGRVRLAEAMSANQQSAKERLGHYGVSPV